MPFALSGGWYLDSSKVTLDGGGLRLLKVQQVTFLTQVADHRHVVVPLLATGHQLLCSRRVQNLFGLEDALSVDVLMKGHYVLVGGGLVELEVARLRGQAVLGRMEVKATRPELRSGLLAALKVVQGRQVALRVELGRTVLQCLLER